MFTRALLAFERRRAREHGIVGCGGAVTAIQRCGSALNTGIHLHTLVVEGVFEAPPAGSQCFIAASAPPTDVEVACLPGCCWTPRRWLRCRAHRSLAVSPRGASGPSSPQGVRRFQKLALIDRWVCTDLSIHV
ncbi:transposase [Candidatus Binatia bacterium]|nr:transposase [Candidatus Binatia bacterium]